MHMKRMGRLPAGVLATTSALLALACAAPALAGASPVRALAAHMLTARAGAVAAPLPDGKILIAGGELRPGSTSEYLKSAELYNPKTEAFESLKSEMTTTRAYAAGAVLPNGDVLIAGGYHPSENLKSAEVYNPTSGKFEALTNTMLASRDESSAIALTSGKVLIIGGYGTEGANTGYLSGAELYNPTSEKFEATKGKPVEGRGEGSAVVAIGGGKALIAGGYDSAYRSGAEYYNEASEEFEAVPGVLGLSEYGAVAFSFGGGEAFIAGGYNEAYFASVEAFDPTTQLFSRASWSLGVRRWAAIEAPLPGGQILVAGGKTVINGAEEYASSAEVISEPQVSAAFVGGNFGELPVGRSSGARVITVMSTGEASLRVSGASLSGPAAADYTIESDRCVERVLAVGESCLISVSFKPAAEGQAAATLTLQDNEKTPSSLTLSGSGYAVSVPSGAVGARGATGLQGPEGRQGPTGAAGPAGKVELVTCTVGFKKVRRHGHVRKLRVRHCTTKTVSGTVRLTLGRGRVALRRGGRLYATGTRIGRESLLLSAARPLRPGRYTLVERARRGGHLVLRREAIEIG